MFPPMLLAKRSYLFFQMDGYYWKLKLKIHKVLSIISSKSRNLGLGFWGLSYLKNVTFFITYYLVIQYKIY